MKIKIYTLSAFSKSNKGGNPAGVVLEADKLSNEQMLKIAQKIGFSETAFVKKSNKADFRISFFTPSEEVDLCGHATIATFFLMKNLSLVQTGKYTQETKAGILDIQVKADNTIFMNQNAPQFFERPDTNEIADSLNISTKSLERNLPIQIVSTGLRDILVPIKNLSDLHSIKANFEKITKISKKYNVIGYHLFTLETNLNSTAQCRNFAPLYDIPEESATGTSNGALSCYLFKYKKINEKQIENLVYEQGYSMKRPSEIFVKLKIDKNQPVEVTVGGVASNIQQKTIEI